MRRTLEETRGLLLAKGLEILHDLGPVPGVTHVRFTDVVRSAGLTTGAAYRIWPRQEDFHLDLAIEAVSYREGPAVREMIRQIMAVVDERQPVPELIRLGAEAHLGAREVSDPYLITLAIRMLSGVDERLREAARTRNEESVEAFTELYDILLQRYRRRMRAPFTTEDLATALAALSEGFVLQGASGGEHRWYELDRPEPGVGARWSLLAVAGEGIVDRMTEPA